MLKTVVPIKYDYTDMQMSEKLYRITMWLKLNQICAWYEISISGNHQYVFSNELDVIAFKIKFGEYIK